MLNGRWLFGFRDPPVHHYLVALVHGDAFLGT